MALFAREDYILKEEKGQLCRKIKTIRKIKPIKKKNALAYTV